MSRMSELEAAHQQGQDAHETGEWQCPIDKSYEARYLRRMWNAGWWGVPVETALANITNEQKGV